MQRIICSRTLTIETYGRLQSHLPTRPAQLFVGIAEWPLVNDLLTDQACALLHAGGLAAWRGAGGRPAADGLPGFGRFSSPALALITDLLAAGRGFRWRDDVGGVWVVRGVRVVDAEAPIALAVTYPDGASLLDPDLRETLLTELADELDRLRSPRRGWTPQENEQFARLRRVQCRWQALSQSVAGLPMLARLARRDDQHLEVSADDWPVLLQAGSEADEFEPGLQRISAGLEAATSIRCGLLRLSTTGWDPRWLHLSSAVESVTHNGQSNYVRASPLLSRVVDTFGGP